MVKSYKLTHAPIIQHLKSNSAVIIWSTSINSISWGEYYEEDGTSFTEKREKYVI